MFNYRPCFILPSYLDSATSVVIIMLVSLKPVVFYRRLWKLIAAIQRLLALAYTLSRYIQVYRNM